MGHREPSYPQPLHSTRKGNTVNIPVICRGGNTINVLGAVLDFDTMTVRVAVAQTNLFDDEPGAVPVPLPLLYPGAPMLPMQTDPEISPLQVWLTEQIVTLVQNHYGA